MTFEGIKEKPKACHLKFKTGHFKIQNRKI